MNINILCVGTLKEKYLKEASAEYEKRLRPYASVKIIEVLEQKAPENISTATAESIKDKEGAKIIEKIGQRDFVAALDIGGEQLSSEELAVFLSDIMVKGTSTITFIIGGSLGLSPAVVSRADLRLSFSKMTFPHQLMRVILLEQVYRGFRIIRGEPYHK